MRRAIFSISELVFRIEHHVSPYLGQVASCADFSPIVLSLLEEYCYGMATDHPPAAEILKTYSIPTDVARQLVESLMNDLCQMVARGFGVIKPNLAYSYEMLGSDVIVTETKWRMREFVPPDNTESLLDQIERGDYIPERLRRSN